MEQPRATLKKWLSCKCAFTQRGQHGDTTCAKKVTARGDQAIFIQVF